MDENRTHRELVSLPSSRKELRELSGIVDPARKHLCVMNDSTLLHLVKGIRQKEFLAQVAWELGRLVHHMVH